MDTFRKNVFILMLFASISNAAFADKVVIEIENNTRNSFSMRLSDSVSIRVEPGSKGAFTETFETLPDSSEVQFFQRFIIYLPTSEPYLIRFPTTEGGYYEEFWDSHLESLQKYHRVNLISKFSYTRENNETVQYIEFKMDLEPITLKEGVSLEKQMSDAIENGKSVG